MYPSLPLQSSQAQQQPQGQRNPYGYAMADGGQLGATHRPAAPALARQQSMDPSPWGAETSSTLRIKVADEYRVDPSIDLPPAMEAVTRPQQKVDFEYERKAMQDEAETSYNAFFATSEEKYYKDTKMGKFISMGYSPTAVSLGLAYQSSSGGDGSKVVDFCNNYTQLLGMGFSPAMSAGALMKTKNDINAATELCLAASS
eukprot:jgi/Chrzof1/7324/Cz02g19130.t1